MFFDRDICSAYCGNEFICVFLAECGYAAANCEGYREYKSRIWHDYIERAENVRHSPIGKVTYALRSQTIKRVFADAKEKHALRLYPYRWLPAVTAWVKLKFAAMNLKNLAIHNWLRLLFLPFYCQRSRITTS